jgi:senataxin
MSSDESSIQDLLGHWYAQFEAIDENVHLVCPRVNDDDDEDYSTLDDAGSHISREEKERRLGQGMERIKITYWTALILGYDARKTGDWLPTFESRLNKVLGTCDKCVINWHMHRSKYLAEYSG